MSTPLHFKILTWIFVVISSTILLPISIYNTYKLHQCKRNQFINARKPQMLLVFGVLMGIFFSFDRACNLIAYGLQPSSNIPLIIGAISYGFIGHGILWLLVLKLLWWASVCDMCGMFACSDARPARVLKKTKKMFADFGPSFSIRNGP